MDGRFNRECVGKNKKKKRRRRRRKKRKQSFDKEIASVKWFEILCHSYVLLHSWYAFTFPQACSVFLVRKHFLFWFLVFFRFALLCFCSRAQATKPKMKNKNTSTDKPKHSTHRWIRITLSLRINYAWTNSNLINEWYGFFFFAFLLLSLVQILRSLLSFRLLVVSSCFL